MNRQYRIEEINRLTHVLMQLQTDRELKLSDVGRLVIQQAIDRVEKDIRELEGLG